MPKHKNWFWLSALAAACLFDYLFWQKGLGGSFVIWITVLFGVGYLLTWREERKPSALSMVLVLLALGFAFVPAWRNEPFTRAISIVLTLTGALLVCATFLNGNWPYYRVADYFKGLFTALGYGIARPFILGSKNGTVPPLPEEPQAKKSAKKGWAVIRGLLIALPVVALFALLLSAADPIFSDWLAKVLNIEKLPEYLFRLFYVIVIGGFLVVFPEVITDLVGFTLIVVTLGAVLLAKNLRRPRVAEESKKIGAVCLVNREPREHP